MAYVVAEPCIKCKYTNCVEVCPVNTLNAQLSKEWPNIATKKEPLPEAEAFKSKDNKRSLLDLNPGK